MIPNLALEQEGPVPIWLTDDEYRTALPVCEHLIPAGQNPGATDAGVGDDVDGLGATR